MAIGNNVENTTVLEADGTATHSLYDNIVHHNLFAILILIFAFVKDKCNAHNLYFRY